MVFGRSRAAAWRSAVVIAIGSAIIAVAWNPVRLAWMQVRAERAIASRDFDKAVAILRTLHERAPSARTAFQLGRAMRRRGDLLGADAAFARAAELGWDSAAIATQRLLAEAQCGDIMDVEAPMERLVGSGPSDQMAEECYEALAHGYLNTLNPEKAAACIEYWSAWQPTNPLVHLCRGRLHEQSEEWATALQHYRSALAVDPNRFESLLAVARMEQEIAHYEEASVLFGRCHALKPDDATSVLGLADCSLKLGDRVGAKMLLFEALTLDLTAESTAIALADLAEIALEDGEIRDARALARQSVGLDPRSPRCALVHASVLTRVGDTEAADLERRRGQDLGLRQVAIAEAARLARVNPMEPDLRAEVGRLMLELGLPREAARWFEIALQIDPAHRASHQALAEIWARVGDERRAERHREALDATSKEESAADQTSRQE